MSAPSFKKLLARNMHFGPNDRTGTPYVSDGDSARALFFVNLSGAYNGNVQRAEAQNDTQYIVDAVNAALKRDGIIS